MARTLARAAVLLPLILEALLGVAYGAAESTRLDVVHPQSSMRIAIVGGGLSGLALANGLVRRGFSNVSVFERRDSYKEQLGSVIGVMPNGFRALKEISESLVHKVVAHGCKVQHMKTVTEQGEKSFARPSEDNENKYGFALHTLQWWRLREQLYNDLPRAEIVSFSKRVADVIEHSDSVSLVFADGSTHECDLLVAADGVHSTVRRHLNLPKGVSTATVSYRGSGSMPADGSPFILGGVDFCNLSKPPSLLYMFRFGNSFSWAFFNGCVFNEQDEVESKLSPEQVLAKLQVVYQGPLEKHCAALVEHTHPESISTTHGFILEPRPEAGGFGGRGRIVLIGDAAHAMPPIDGLGGNLAFEDCACLIRELVKDGDISDLVTRFEEARFQRVSLLHQSQHRKHIKWINVGFTASPDDSKGILEGGMEMDDQARDWVYKGI